MKIEANKKENCQVELKVTLDAGEVAPCVKDVERKLVREVRYPGFRQGKVPLELIRKEFSGALTQEVYSVLAEKYCREAIAAEKLDCVNVLGVTEINYSAEGGEFTAMVEVRPTFKLPAYKGLKIAPVNAVVTDEQVNEQVENIRISCAKYENSKEGDVVKKGDFVQIDYAGKVGKKAITELNPDAKVVAEGKGFWTQVEDGRFLPEILAAIEGMKVGEEKTGVKVKFDKNAAPEGLKGEKAEYTVKVTALRGRVLLTNEELVSKAQVESFEKLVANVREQMEKDALERENVRRENEAVELLLKKADFDLPLSAVKAQCDTYLKRLAESAQASGLPAEYFEKNRESIMKDAEEKARRQVRLWYILAAIADAEKIDINANDFSGKAMQFVLDNAKK